VDHPRRDRTFELREDEEREHSELVVIHPRSPPSAPGAAVPDLMGGPSR
jgi:hypothetical protein